MAGGIREGAGRKAVEIDLLELEKLCSMLCSDEDIASWVRRVGAHDQVPSQRSPNLPKPCVVVKPGAVSTFGARK
jgi:hypothetical protein